MNARTWQLTVRDARGRRRRGSVTYADAVPDVLQPPKPPDEFSILMLAAGNSAIEAPECTAICIPGVPKIHALGDAAHQDLPSRIEHLMLSPPRMAAYAAGRIVTATGDLAEAADIFPPHADHPRFDRMALALLAVADAEAVAPYIALIRLELGLRARADPLAELGARLLPEEPKERPPVRAPGIVRLAKALRRLRDGLPPAATPEVMAEDLRFLRLFEDHAWSTETLGRLLDDVQKAPAPRRKAKAPAGAARTAKAAARAPSNVVPLRGRRSRPRGHA